MDVKAANSDLYLPQEQTRKPKQILDKDAFLLIMIEQLKNQDPTSPMDSDKFISQMAQFTTLEQLTNLNKQFTDMLHMQQMNQGAAIIGNPVSLVDGEDIVAGTVEKLLITKDAVKVVINGTAYDINSITTVEAKPEPEPQIIKVIEETGGGADSDQQN